MRLFAVLAAAFAASSWAQAPDPSALSMPQSQGSGQEQPAQPTLPPAMPAQEPPPAVQPAAEPAPAAQPIKKPKRRRRRRSAPASRLRVVKPEPRLPLPAVPLSPMAPEHP